MVTLKKQVYYHPSETHKGMKWVNLICLLCLMLVNILFCKYYLECKLTTNQLHKWSDVILLYLPMPVKKILWSLRNSDSSGGGQFWSPHQKPVWNDISKIIKIQRENLKSTESKGIIVSQGNRKMNTQREVGRGVTQKTLMAPNLST